MIRVGLLVLVVLFTSSSVWANDIKTVIGGVNSDSWKNTCLFESAPQAQTSDCSTTKGCLNRVTLDSSRYPYATCNDGSPGTFYIREGRGVDKDKWIVHLEGGAWCTDGTTCLQRWCGEQGIYDASKMSSDWDPYDHANGGVSVPSYAANSDLALTKDIQGIFAQDVANNHFKDWTHVYVHYCSSDRWMGRQSNVSYTTNLNQSFELDNRGHTILTAVRRVLRGQKPHETDNGQKIPDIDTATHVIFSGTSAGAAGALYNADWFFSTLPQTQQHFLVLDGAMAPTTTQASVFGNGYPIWVWDTSVISPFAKRYNHYIRDLELDSWNGGFYNKINAFVDESCEQTYGPIGELYKCSSPERVLTQNINEIDTETFIRFDLEDNVLSRPWTTSSNPYYTLGFYGAQTSMATHIDIQRASLVQLFDEYNSVTGVYAPRCGSHATFTHNDRFHQQSLKDVSNFGNTVSSYRRTTNQALFDWLFVSTISQRTLDADTNMVSSAGGETSDCP